MEEPKIMSTAISVADENEVDYQDKYLRVLADFENYKRRTNAEIERIKSEATHEFIKDLLPIIDDVRSGLLMYNKIDKNEYNGILIINNEITKLLNKYGIEEYGHVGEKFDSDLHEAVYISLNKNVGSGNISEVVKLGYRTKGGKIIRYAKVNVEQ